MSKSTRVPANPLPDDLLSVAQAAREFDLPSTWLRTCAVNGVLPRVKNGRLWHFRRADILCTISAGVHDAMIRAMPSPTAETRGGAA